MSLIKRPNSNNWVLPISDPKTNIVSYRNKLLGFKLEPKTGEEQVEAMVGRTVRQTRRAGRKRR